MLLCAFGFASKSYKPRLIYLSLFNLCCIRIGSVTIHIAAKHNTGGNKKIVYDKISLHNNGEIVTYPRSHKLVVSVTDTGAGMTKEQLKKVFAEGVQFNVNKLQAGKGSGLGMYITKGIVEQHGGSLTVNSGGPGLGSTFIMKLPLYNVPEDQRPKTEKAKSSRRGNGALSTNKNKDDDKNNDDSDSSSFTQLYILVVDDSAMNRKLLVRLLKNQGHVVEEAEDGDVAVQKVKEAASTLADKKVLYDSILMDYQMPNMDGPDACKEIRAMGCDSFIIGITGALFAEQVKHFTECGANRVLPKPLDMNALIDCWMEYGVMR